jgi:ABC-type multidrug transport system fused ATPase/permease subunit
LHNPEREEKPSQPLGDIEKPKNGKEVSPTKKLMKYMKAETGTFVWATIGLVGGNLGQLVIPYYIGMFTDAISNKRFNEVSGLTWQLAIIVFVRILHFKGALPTQASILIFIFL